MKKFLLLILLAFCVALIYIFIAPNLSASKGFKRSDKAVQTIYQENVPHTDKMGRQLMQFDEERSFLPICMYHALTGDHHGQQYSFAPLKQAGFNCVHTWEGQKLDSIIEPLRKENLQLIYHRPKNAEIKKYANDPNILGWYLDEEPTGHYWGSNMNAKFDAFQKRMQEIKAIDKIHPVFIVDTSWIKFPVTAWWIKWNTAGDVSSHVNYALKTNTKSLSRTQGIPETVTLAVTSNNQRKPLWFVTQVFASKPGVWKWTWKMPNPNESRAMVYSSLIHGATGMIYFALDSWVTRNGNVFGVAPNLSSDYAAKPKARHFVVSEEELEESRQLWEEVVRINQELEQLKPTILSPTSRESYKVYVQGERYTDDPVRCLLKETDGQFTLLTVNLDKKPLTVRYEFPRKLRNLQIMFEEGRILDVKNSSWVDNYEEFGVHVYQFRLE